MMRLMSISYRETRMRRKILFVSTNSSVSWGGSEVLWSEVALRLLLSGHVISASVPGWPERAMPVAAMMEAGVDVRERWIAPVGLRPKLLRRVCDGLIRHASLLAFSRWLDREQP